MFGVGFTRGFNRSEERINNRRAKVFQAFQQWKQDNPYATAADFQNAVRSIGGGDLTVVGTLPGQQAIQRMAADNQRKKQEAERAKQFEAMERKLRYQNSLTSAVGNAVQLMGDKADAATIANQLGIPVEQVAPAVERAKAQAAQAENDRQRKLFNEGLAYQDRLAQQALNAGMRGDDFDTFISQGMNEYSRRTGLTLSSGTVGGEPSSEQAAMTANASRYRMLADAAEEKDATLAYNTLIQLSNTPAFKAQVLEDPTAAIDSLITSAQLDLSDNVLAMARTKLETSVGEKAKAWRQEQKNNAVTEATALVGAALENNALADPAVITETVQAELERNGMASGLATEAIDVALGNAEGTRRNAYDANYQPADPTVVIAGLQARRQEQAASIIDNMSSPQGKEPGRVMGTDITMVSNPEKQEMTRALAQFNYSSPSEAQDIVDIMTAYINEERGKGPTPNAADLIAVVEKANKDITFFEDDLSRPWIGGMTVRDQIMTHVNQDFSSTEDLIAADIREARDTDEEYILANASGEAQQIDITMEGIEEVANGAGSKAERQLELGNIREAIQSEIEGARMYRAAVIANSISVEKDLIVPPQARLGFDVEFDEAAYVAAIDARISDLEKRYKATDVKLVDVTGTNDGGLSPARVPLPGEPLVGTRRVDGRDVFFTEVINAKPEDYKLYEYSIVDSFKLNAGDQGQKLGLERGAPAIYGALTKGVPDDRVVKGLARGIEAYHFLMDKPFRTREEYVNTIDRIGLSDVSDRRGLISNQSRDRDAQYYAAILFKDATQGMASEEQDALLADFFKLLEASKTRSRGKADANQYGLRNLDLPRLSESMR